MLNVLETEEFLKENFIFYKKDVSMKNITSFKIGGFCKIVSYPENLTQFKVLIKFCKDKKISYFFLGNATNLLFPDEDYFGIAICSKKLNKIKILSENKIYCESGVSLFELCRFCYLNSFSNLEKLYGIPGSLGGAILMNAGAYGCEIKDVIYSVTYLDYSGNLCTLKTKDLNFSYRYSLFQDKDFFIVSAILNLKKGMQEEIKTTMDLILKKRKEKQPLNLPNAGSIFKRPAKDYAARLIEECGLKGAQINGAMVSKKHAGFIVNVKNATAFDVKKLIEKIKKTVKEKKKVDLNLEIKILEQTKKGE